jgi:DNA primase
MIGLCPFHNEKTPSFTVNEDKGFFHCFGCGAHGDVIGFVMRAEHLSFPETVERLASEAGLEVPQSSPQEREQAKRQASMLDATEAACAFFEKELHSPRGRGALDYLKGRGLEDETIARFRLGYDPDERGALKKALDAAHIPLALAQEAGLLTVPEGGGDPFDRFHGRVMFPITDRRGRVVAFGGRILREGQPKYLNSPDGPLFHKGHMLYGLSQARASIAEQGTAVVCEGYMDVIALHQAGFSYAVAPLGTALTENQIELLWRFVPEPIICLDGDAAGQRAALRAAERALPLLKPEFSLRFARIASADDPDSLIKRWGTGAMRKVLQDALPLSAIIWNRETTAQSANYPEQRARLEKKLMDVAESIADRRVQKEYKRYFAAKLWEQYGPKKRSHQWARAGTPQYLQQGRSGGLLQRGPDGRFVGLSRPPYLLGDPRVRLERMILVTLINHTKLIEEVTEELGGLAFRDEDLEVCRQDILVWEAKSHGSEYIDLKAFFANLNTNGIFLDLRRQQMVETFAAPDRPVEVVRLAWRALYGRIALMDLDLEKEIAMERFGGAEFGTDFAQKSLEILSRIRAEQLQRIHLLGADDVWEARLAAS